MTIQDLSVLLAALDIAVKRGTFSILEVGQVSAVAERLNNFLADAQKQAAEQSQAQGEAQGEAQSETPAEAA